VAQRIPIWKVLKINEKTESEKELKEINRNIDTTSH
jgi:hypothetical protein